MALDRVRGQLVRALAADADGWGPSSFWQFESSVQRRGIRWKPSALNDPNGGLVPRDWDGPRARVGVFGPLAYRPFASLPFGA